MPEKFGEADEQRVRDIIAVNIVGVNEMTRIALPLLLKNKDKGLRGLILNIGSASGILPTPMLAPYAASKSYVAAFSTALQYEYAADGVDIDCPLPFFVVSNMSKRSRPTATIPTADAYVRSSLAKVGHGDLPLAPYVTHALMAFVIDSIPSVFAGTVVRKNLDMVCCLRLFGCFFDF